MKLLQAAEEGLTTGTSTNLLLPIVLGIIMLGMGLGLRPQHFKLIFTQPKGITAGLLGQIVLLPIAGGLVATVAILVFNMETELALGLLLLAAVPGGATSNLLTWLARGDTALSVSLTAITSVFSLVLTPAVLFLTTFALWGQGQAIRVDFVEVIKLTASVVVGPVLIGMLIGTKWPRVATVTEKPMRIFSIFVLTVLIAGIIYQNRVGFWGFAAATVPAALALNALALGAGFLTAYLFKLGTEQTKSVVIEVGFQNGTFGIVLAVSQLDSARAALVPGFYSLVMYATGAIVATSWGKIRAARATAAAQA